MFVFYTSFGGNYAPGNSIRILGWKFTDLEGNPYTSETGTMDDPKLSGKKAWTRDDHGMVAPFFLPDQAQQVNVLSSSPRLQREGDCATDVAHFVSLGPSTGFLAGTAEDAAYGGLGNIICTNAGVPARLYFQMAANFHSPKTHVYARDRDVNVVR